ncbi:MAG: PQQ-binding-like beta-propeller repeat protein [Planctomycetes bacterium]|nr:PQQ-binding-like beta-propeller repeat protein [Planctomycetota bacterium]
MARTPVAHRAIHLTAWTVFCILACGSALLGQTIATVTPNSAPNSGRVRVTGAGFGAAGELLFDGQPGVVSRWSATEIVGFVPESVALGPVSVVVQTASGTSAPMTITVEPRIPNGRVKWRFLLDSWAISGQPPGIGPDGSIYFDEGFGDLYALDPNGGLKWIYDSTEVATGGPDGGGREGPIPVAADGTVILGATLLGGIARIHAVNPDGSRRWVFETGSTQGVIVGPGIGPDGNIYAAVDNAFTGSIGVFSLDPLGNLRWSDPGAPAVGEYGQAYGHRIAFGADRFHFAAKPGGGGGAPTLWTFSFGGDQEWVSTSGYDSDPATDALNRVIVASSFYGVTAYEPDGDVAWQTAPPESGSSIIAPVLSPSGDIFVGHGFDGIWSLDSNGVTRFYEDGASFGIPANFGVTPSGAYLLEGGRQTFGVPGWVRAYSTVDGALEWQVDLPDVGGDFVTNSRPAFSPDGSTAYVCVIVLGSSSDSYLYAIDVTGGAVGLFERGDCNTDGLFDISDAVRALGALFVPGSDPLGCRDACDTNDDGLFDISDAVFALNALFVGGAATLPAPVGICGVDGTLDGLDCEADPACP